MTDPPAPPGLVARVKEYTALLAGLSVVFYAALRMVYVSFYSRFGLVPEEVGLGKAEILAQAAAGPIVLVAFISLLVFAVVWVYVVFLPMSISTSLRSMMRSLRIEQADLERARSQFEQQWLGKTRLGKSLFEMSARIATEGRRTTVRQELTKSIRPIAVFSLVVGSVLAFAILPLRAIELADGLTIRGEPIHVTSGTVGPLPMLQVRAEPVEVVAPDGSTEAAFASECLVYLGEAEDRIMVYDVRDAVLLRIPSGDVVTRVRTGAEPLEDCAISPS
ncbi:MAG TPA: hypothetical protein VGB83_03910 [Actinomycetota bacterium]